MRLCLLINPTDNWQQAVAHARKLVTASAEKHEVIGLFFYGSAAKIIADPKQQAQWLSFSNIPLYICRTMVEQHNLCDELLEPPFTVIGMAPWVVLMEQADRIVEII
ncbi:DsrE family protein [Marinicella gelatinilytica]|uniref:DsrE family protein n=1 Tax=Marinicella gelatinilytica TaxID=2996017 RepID=UPI0022608DEE|nr:DsrE family protein [Marinicella gelatinilytica]MCX7545532.1 DsrE family protein [Marinicella gelatinilytica]